MRSFLLKIIAFLSILILYLGVNTRLNYIIIKGSELPINRADILIVGDSHFKTAIDPSGIVSAENISQNAEPYIITYWKLKYIFRYFKPKILILGYAHHNISAFNDLKFWDEKWSAEMFRRSYLIQEFNSLDSIRVDRQEFYKTFLREMCIYPHKDHFNFIGSYANSNKSDQSDLEATIKRHYYYADSEPSISTTAIAYLDRIIRLCKNEDIRVILVGTPVTKKYFELIPEKIKQKYILEKQRLINEGITVADYVDTFYEDAFYLNPDHLNERGAQEFTNEINTILIHLD